MILQKIPNIDITNAKPAPIGFSGDQVFLIEKGYQGRDIVVKIASDQEVIYEAENFEWLQQYTRVPRIYATGKVEQYYYVIMEKLPGVMMQEEFHTCSPEEIVVQYAKLLKQFHSIESTGLPHNHSLKDKLVVAKRNVENNLVREQYFERELRHLSAREVYAQMLVYKSSEDLVLCHGDFCFPNIIINQHQLSGFIDIMGIGICDRYLDLAIALRSLRYNFELYGHCFKEEDQTLFLQEYGIQEVDMKKITFYILLDELLYR